MITSEEIAEYVSQIIAYIFDTYSEELNYFFAELAAELHVDNNQS